MNQNLLRSLSCALALAGVAHSQSPPHRSAQATRCEGFPDTMAAPSARLELRLAGRDPARLELRGGAPGSPSSIAVADSFAAAPILTHGTFDADGLFAQSVDLAALPRGAFVCQGYGAACDLDGRWAMAASNGLCVQIADEIQAPTVPAAPTEADFSLLRIQLDARRDVQVKDQVLAGDLVGALGTALNSHGDALLAKFGGKIMILVPGTPVQAGGSVAYSAKIARDGDEYLVSIGQDVAVLCGVKATAKIGVEGGVTLGADQIYRFASPAEVARGLCGIALQQALPGNLELARGENLAKVRALRGKISTLVAALDSLRSQRLCRLPAAERALDALLSAVVAVHGRCRRIGDALDRAAGWVCDEAQFVRDHTDGAEMRLGTAGEVSLKVGDKKFGDRVGAELGGKANGGFQVTVRLFQGYGEEPRRIEVLCAHAVGGSFGAGFKLGGLADNNERAFGRGFEISQKTTRGVRSVYERHGRDFGAPTVTIVLKREFGLLSFGRETTIEFDAVELGQAGVAAALALLDGEPAGVLAAALPVSAHIAVQDKLTLAMKPEFGVEVTALTAKVSAECSWSDCGPLRQCDRTLAEVIEHLLDVRRVAAELEQLVQDVLALPELM